MSLPKLSVNVNMPSMSTTASSEPTIAKNTDYSDNAQYQLLYNMYYNHMILQQQQILQQQHQMVMTPKSPSPITPLSVAETPKMTKVIKRHNMVILDWDDTCYPTTYFVQHRMKPTVANLGAFGKCLYQFLDALINTFTAKNIYIITNAAKDWVFRSLRESSKAYQQFTDHKEDYFAAIYNSLYSAENIQIISAQDLYKDLYPNQPLRWKISAFKDITRRHFNLNDMDEDKYCILSIGDGEDEWSASLEAKQVLSSQLKANQQGLCEVNTSQILLHRIKLMDDPDIDRLMRQLVYLAQIVNDIPLWNDSEAIRFKYE